MSGTNPFRRRNDETSGSVDDYGVTDRAQTQTPISDTGLGVSSFLFYGFSIEYELMVIS